MRKGNALKYLLIYLVLLLAGISIQKIFNLTITNVEEWILSFGNLAPIVYALLLFLGLSVPFNPISDYFIVNVAAFTFPPTTSIAATFLAHSLAICINFHLARLFGWQFLNRILGKDESKKLHKLSQEITYRRIFLMRWILPLTTIGIDLVSFAAGLAKLKFVSFYLASIIPWTILNIAFFTGTHFAKKEYFPLFFIPGLILIGISLTISYFLIKYKKI